MKRIIIILFLILFSGCALTKRQKATDKSTTTTTTEKRTTIRPGDTVTINIPNVRFKDTVIERINYDTKTISRVTYDNQGNQRFDCVTAEIREQIELMRQDVRNDIENKKDVDTEFNPQKFIYAIAILVFVVIIAILVLVFSISKLKKEMLTLK